MRNGTRTIAIIGVALATMALVVALTAVYLVSTAEDDYRSLQGTVADVIAEHDATQAKLDATRAKLDATSTDEVTALRKQLATAKTTLVTLGGRVERAEKKMEHYDYCLPELRNEAQSVTFQGQEFGEADGYLTNGYLSHAKEVSRFCIDLFTDAQSNRVQEGSGD